MGLKDVSQTALDERTIEDSELEKALEDREVAKGKAGEARKKVETLTDVVKAKVETLGLEEGNVARVGRFRLEQAAVAGKSVSFETEPTTQLKITTPKNDG